MSQRKTTKFDVKGLNPQYWSFFLVHLIPFLYSLLPPVSQVVMLPLFSPSVLQMSMDRLHMLELVAASWPAPIALALYATDADTVRFTAFYASSTILATRCNIAVHVVYAEGEFFPVNFLRYVALRQVRLDNVLVILSENSQEWGHY